VRAKRFLKSTLCVGRAPEFRACIARRSFALTRASRLSALANLRLARNAA
jgi:hypothetical protein